MKKVLSILLSVLVIETKPFLEMTGYDSADVRAYLNSVESFYVERP